jgi:hypothetical protein
LPGTFSSNSLVAPFAVQGAADYLVTRLSKLRFDL